MRGTGPVCGPLVLSWVTLHVDRRKREQCSVASGINLSDRNDHRNHCMNQRIQMSYLGEKNPMGISASPIFCLVWFFFFFNIKKLLGRSIVNGWLPVKVRWCFSRHCMIHILLLTYLRSLEGRYPCYEILAKVCVCPKCVIALVTVLGARFRADYIFFGSTVGNSCLFVVVPIPPFITCCFFSCFGSFPLIQVRTTHPNASEKSII